MAAIQHVFRRGAIYYWRRRWPPGFGAPAGQQSLCLSLRTACVATARRRGVALSAAFDNTIGMRESVHINSREIDWPSWKAFVERAVRGALSCMCDEAERERAQRPPDPTGRLAEDLAKGHEGNADALQRLLLTNQFEDGQADLASGDICARLGLDLKPGTPEMAYAARTWLRAMQAFHRRQALHERGVYPDDEQVFLAPLSVSSVPSRAPLDAELVPAPPPQPRELPGDLLADLLEKYSKERSRAGSWINKSRVQTFQTCALFSEFTGIQRTGGVTRQAASTFKEKLFELPANYKSQKKKGLTASEIAASSAVDDGEKLKAKTINRHLSAMKKFWVWMKAHGYVAGENPFASLHIQRSKRETAAYEERAMFSNDDLEKILNSAPYRGRHSKRFKYRPGALVIKDQYFWVPLMGAFTGARLGEICQALVDDIRQEDGLWCLFIQGGNGKSLKTKHARRVIPLHPVLIDAGILDHVDACRAAGHTRLFPDLLPGGPDNTFAAKASERFTELCRLLGLAKGKSFHSLRHTFDTFLQRAGVDERHVAALLGHRATNETSGRYFKGFEPRQLHAAICKLDYGIDLSHITPPQPGVQQHEVKLVRQAVVGQLEFPTA